MRERINPIGCYSGQMTDDSDPPKVGWFVGIESGNLDAASAGVIDGSAEEPADWPALAVQSGHVESEDAYYKWLHEATLHATRSAVHDRERSDDQQLIQSVRAIDDCTDKVNELAERVADWAGAYYGEQGSGVDYVRTIADREPDSEIAERIVGLATRTEALAAEQDSLRRFVERQAPDIAPNLAAIAGPVLAARLIALAGGLEKLAKKPSGTVQVLGAEDALFAHLADRAPSPKHGIIYTHEYVRGTRPEDRGSAARALAGKLSIAARVDHFSGKRKPTIDDDLDTRMERIRERGAR